MPRRLLALLLVAVPACGGSGDGDVCAGYQPPTPVDLTVCDDPDAADPAVLGTCLRGSGAAGGWTVDADGLPAYDLAIDHRCDPIAAHYTPRDDWRLDPVHLIGNGRGLQAMAHASGGVALYSQDRGHKWLSRVDGWRDPANLDYPVQLGGGFAWIDAGGRLVSTRRDDWPAAEATLRLRQRFGVGYVDTEVTDERAVISHRVFAPDVAARALVAEVTVHNPTSDTLRYRIVEVLDPDLFEVPVELATSDLLNPSITDTIDRRRRDLQARFTHQLAWSELQQVALMTTSVREPPAGVDRDTESEVDWYPEPLYLAVLDEGVAADAVWLDDRELWGDDPLRPLPAAVAGEGSGASRATSAPVDGAGQHPFLAVRVTVDVAPGESVTRRFALGYLPGDAPLDGALAELRVAAAELRPAAVDGWRRRLVWAAFPGLPDAGVVQRELTWSSYSVLAGASFDEYRGVRVLGQGGSYKYIHGLDGAIGDLALFAEALLLIDPALARDTLVYAFASQHGDTSQTPWRFPYASTGVGEYSDVGIYDQRSDAYFLMPAMTARYVAVTRDRAFLDAPVPFWPRAGGDASTVLDHLRRTREYAEASLGIGARGLVAIGTGDYADGVLNLTDEPATGGGSSSTYNAGFVVHGFPLAADVVEPADAALATYYRDLAAGQAAALDAEAWAGEWYHRGFVDSGNPLAPDILFLEPQLFPILAGLVTPERRAALLALIDERMETSIGAVSNIPLGDGGSGGIDQPQLAGVWPVANAWLTEAWSLQDPAAAWSSFIRNTLAAHADAYPGIWYGVWTGPDSYHGPDHERAGEADAHLVTALTDYPALNMHVHTSPLRALAGLLGIAAAADGLTIAPRVPGDTFAVIWPRLTLRASPTSIEGSITASATDTFTLRVLLPAGLRAASFQVTAGGQPVAYTRTGDLVAFAFPATADTAVAWRIF